MAIPDLPPDRIRRLTRRAFGVLAVGGLAGASGLAWLRFAGDDDDIPWPLRAMHRFNEAVGRRLFSPNHLAPEFAVEQVTPGPRVNGERGRPEGEHPWTIRVERPSAAEQTFSVAGLLAGLPRVEAVTEFKCIEGWSQVVQWGGVRFADAAAKHGWPVATHPYVGLATADGEYYVGLDTPSALHPQTLLCDTMNGQPLPAAHGGPIRLVVPVKYGIKNLKWLARIRFGTEPTADYWAKRGYDWYAGL
jgi:DMSO/TMAO reductase YedYZ molybdopterin-dependent catalytic subunit